MAQSFQIDLGGIVDLLGRHLYSTPRVYLRELVQNAVDALTAREEQAGPDGDVELSIVVTPSDVTEDGRLQISDSGIGLTRDDIDSVLSTIGGSSKRDELGFSRQGFLGHFGIGLLSCFLVTDEVEIVTRAVNGEETLRWRGRSDGTFVVDIADRPRSEPGTDVSLAPRPGQRELLSADLVGEMLRTYTRHLPRQILLRTAETTTEVADRRFCWEDPSLAGPARRAAAVDLCRAELGFVPMDVISLSDPGSGSRGYAFVPPTPIGRSTHRVYAHNMLVTENEPDLLPEWAFFVRSLINTDHLKLTASRESLQDDDDLATVRDRLGEQLRQWLLRTAQTNPARIDEFVAVHHLGMRAMAVQDEAMLELVARFLPFETTVGSATLDALLVDHPSLRYCDNDGDFRQVSQIASAQQLAVINAGHAYDVEILQAIGSARQGCSVTRLDPQDLIGYLAEADPADHEFFGDLADDAANTLVRTDVRIELRSFEPATVAVLLLSGRRDAVRAVEDDLLAGADGVWGDVLSSLPRNVPTHPRFVINTNNPDMRRLAAYPDAEFAALAIRALYAHALAAGRHRLTPFDATVLHQALPALLKRTLDLQEL